MARSSWDKLCHCLWDPCTRNENPVGSPWRSQAGTQVLQSVLQDEMRQTPHLCWEWVQPSASELPFQ